MKNDFALFTDRREPDVTARDGYWVLRTLAPDADPDAVVRRLRQIDWAYPAKLLYRTESEDTWSFVTLGLSLRDLGEAG